MVVFLSPCLKLLSEGCSPCAFFLAYSKLTFFNLSFSSFSLASRASCCSLRALMSYCSSFCRFFNSFSLRSSSVSYTSDLLALCRYFSLTCCLRLLPEILLFYGEMATFAGDEGGASGSLSFSSSCFLCWKDHWSCYGLEYSEILSGKEGFPFYS